MDVSTHELELQQCRGTMEVSTQYWEIPLSVPPSTMFDRFILQGHTLIPREVPLVIESVKSICCDGTPVKPICSDKTLVTFGKGCPYKSVKLKTFVTDNVNFTYTGIIFEGDPALMDKFESITYHIKFVETSDCPIGGAIYKCWTTFITKGEHRLTKMDIQNDRAYQTYIVKAIEAYVIANLRP